MATATIRPNADSATHDGTWVLTGGTAGLAYTTIDEASPDDTDYISSSDTSSPYDRQAVELENMPAASAISSVVIWFRSRCASSTLGMIPFYRQSGSDTDKGTAVTVSTTPTDYSWDITADRTWTDTLINGLEIGWRRNTGAANALRITQAWVEITYTPPPTTFTRTIPVQAVLVRQRIIPVTAVLAHYMFTSAMRTNQTVTSTDLNYDHHYDSHVALVFITAMATNGVAPSILFTIGRIDLDGARYPVGSGYTEDPGEFAIGLDRPAGISLAWPAYYGFAEVTGDVTFEVLILPDVLR